MRQEWFDRARFGMFVHFGLYSGAARHEWVQNYERLTDEDYRQYFEHFDPDLFDAAALARTAKETGMDTWCSPRSTTTASASGARS